MDFKQAKPLIIEIGKAYTGREDFSLSGDKEDVYEKLFYYFTNQEQAQRRGLSVEKGVLLFGPVGVGKSVSLVVMKRFYQSYLHDVNNYDSKLSSKFAFQIHSASSIALSVSEHGLKQLKFYNSLPLCIDDMGMESPVIYYGTKIDAIAELLYHRHIRKSIIHATTNCTPDDFASLYGMRISDRLKEMFNFIVFDADGISMRR